MRLRVAVYQQLDGAWAAHCVELGLVVLDQHRPDAMRAIRHVCIAWLQSSFTDERFRTSTSLMSEIMATGQFIETVVTADGIGGNVEFTYVERLKI